MRIRSAVLAACLALALDETDALAALHTPHRLVRAAVPPRQSLRPWCSVTSLVQESGGGGGRGPGSGEGGGGGGGGGEGDDEAADVSAALARAGLEAEQVSADVLAALAEGRIGAKELSNWAKVLDQPLSRLLAHSSYIRDRLLAAPSLHLGVEIVGSFEASYCTTVRECACLGK